jgi:hypothetical protein
MAQVLEVAKGQERREELARNELSPSKLRDIKKLNLSQGRHPRMFLSGVQSEHFPWIPAKSMRE